MRGGRMRLMRRRLGIFRGDRVGKMLLMVELRSEDAEKDW